MESDWGSPVNLGIEHLSEAVSSASESSSLSRRRLFQEAAAAAVIVALPAAARPASALAAPTEGATVDPYILEGELTGISKDAFELLARGRTRQFSFAPSSRVWRGGEASPTALEEGDDFLVKVNSSGALVRGWANLARVQGTVVESSSRSMVIQRGEIGGSGALTEVVLATNARTYDVTTNDRAARPGFLPPESPVDVIGLDQGDQLLGTNVGDASLTSDPSEVVPTGPAVRPTAFSSIHSRRTASSRTTDTRRGSAAGPVVAADVSQ